MDENTNDGPLDTPINPLPENQSNNSIAATSETDLIIPKDKANNMEIHHHAHHTHGEITWKTYFWEFLMLFLAVLCGSLAEYKLEHVIEYKRAKEYAASMINDLAVDTSNLKDYKKYYSFVNANVDTLINLLTRYDPKDIPTGKLYWYGLFGGAPRIFISNDATIEQMKGSGSLRYFTNKTINQHVAMYDQLCREMKTYEDNDMYLFTEVRKMRAQIFEFRYNIIANEVFRAYQDDGFRTQIDSFIASNPPVLTYDKSIFNQYVELVRSRVLERKSREANTLLQQAVVLMNELKKEYHLE